MHAYEWTSRLPWPMDGSCFAWTPQEEISEENGMFFGINSTEDLHCDSLAHWLKVECGVETRRKILLTKQETN